MTKPSAGMRPYLRSLAGWAWNRQNDAKKHGLSLQEETLTEMLLLRLAKECGPLGLHVKMFTRPQEKRNGADWEWFVRGSGCAVGYRVQAKRLYSSGPLKGQYGGHNPTGTQTDKLIKMAGTSCVPLYVFYNHSSSSVFDGRGAVGFRGPSFWGCSYANAKSVKAVNSRKPSDLIKVMHPWHELFDFCTKPMITTSALWYGKGAMRIEDTGSSPLSPDSRREPEWLNLLNQPAGMDDYLGAQELAGVAYIDASTADLDWSAD
ncbi:MAG: hypothetical protein EP341_04475 [Sphingomonadales bacterium]|nr:MAG: hypothetical protein EP341_04475 [Sphingomonadales bacterium]